MWADSDQNEVRAVWGEALGRFEAVDIKRSLETMLHAYPDYPPTLPQFLGMCREARAARTQETTKVTYVRYSQVAPEVLAEIHKVSSLHANRKKDPRDWARKILAREQAGERVPVYALFCAREALGIAPVEVE